VAKNDIATTAKPPIAMSRTRPIDDRMADFSPYRSPRGRFYTRACQTAKGWLQRRAIGRDRPTLPDSRHRLPAVAPAHFQRT
jgi:hypothetical protein